MIDPLGNNGKSSFARAYVSQEPTDAILMKIDNLDRMELALIQKISNYRDRYVRILESYSLIFRELLILKQFWLLLV